MIAFPGMLVRVDEAAYSEWQRIRNQWDGGVVKPFKPWHIFHVVWGGYDTALIAGINCVIERHVYSNLLYPLKSWPTMFKDCRLQMYLLSIGDDE